MTDEQKTDEQTTTDLLDVYGGRAKILDEIRKDMFRDMNRHILSVVGLVAFKLITQELARAATFTIEDPNERIHKRRQIKESIRQRVINEWKTTGPASTLTKVRSTVNTAFPDGALSDEELQSALDGALADIDSWTSQAFDLTPSVADLMASLNATENSSQMPEETPKRVEEDEGVANDD